MLAETLEMRKHLLTLSLAKPTYNAQKMPSVSWQTMKD
jgi:hypothetical protein